MRSDFNSIKYLEEAVDAKQHKLITAGIKKSWEDCLEKNQHIFDCKILSARWVENTSALAIFEECYEDIFDNTPHNVIEAKYSIWITSDRKGVWTPEQICRITNTLYLYKYPKGSKYPYTIGYIDEIEHETLEGGIESTQLSEEGVLELLASLENGTSAEILAELKPEELPDNLHPKVRELHGELHAKFLEQEAAYEESMLEQKRMVLEFSAKSCYSEYKITLPSKHENYFFMIELLYSEGCNESNELLIKALPPFKHYRARRDPIWKHAVIIPSVKIEDASQYLKEWVENPDNLELLRTLHFQSRDNGEKK